MLHGFCNGWISLPSPSKYTENEYLLEVEYDVQLTNLYVKNTKKHMMLDQMNTFTQ